MEDLRVSSSIDGNGFWVPKGSLSFEEKLSIEKTMLWHQKLGHIGKKGLRTFKNKKPCNLEFDLFEHCIYGKQSCIQFYLSSHKTCSILDLIHYDVFGPIDVPLIGKSTY